MLPSELFFIIFLFSIENKTIVFAITTLINLRLVCKSFYSTFESEYIEKYIFKKYGMKFLSFAELKEPVKFDLYVNNKSKKFSHTIHGLNKLYKLGTIALPGTISSDQIRNGATSIISTPYYKVKHTIYIAEHVKRDGKLLYDNCKRPTLYGVTKLHDSNFPLKFDPALQNYNIIIVCFINRNFDVLKCAIQNKDKLN
jgi:hypothetical protein